MRWKLEQAAQAICLILILVFGVGGFFVIQSTSDHWRENLHRLQQGIHMQIEAKAQMCIPAKWPGH